MRSFEPLELRLLLAADLACDHDPTDDTATEIASTITTDDADAIVSSAAFSIRDAGSTAGTAQDLGTLGASQTYSGSVGGSDIRDVMKFSIAAKSTVTLSLTGLSRDIDLYLYDGSGRLLKGSEKAGAASESISMTLEAGSYYVAVTPYRLAFSNYVLSIGVTGIATPPTTNPTTNPPTTNPPTTNPTNPTSAFPDVAYFGGSNDWDLNAINAPEAWAKGYTGQGVVVAVVDTGVDLTHPDLLSSIWVNAGEIAGNGVDDDHDGYIDDVHGWDFASNDSNPTDGNGHGTHVAGTIAADNNGVGSTGVAPDATIMPVRVLDNNGSGTSAGVAAGIRYAVQHGANIINLSLGGGYSSQILSAIQYALQSNVLVVAAAGNESAATPGYPAIFSSTLANVLSVGAYAAGNAIASFSNDVGGSGAVQVDAPGVGIYSTYMGGGYARLSGTSMATPHVVGLAALALSANHNLTASQLRTLIVDGTNITVSGSDSNGGVNAALTVALAAAGQVSGSSTSAAAAAASAAGQVASVRRIVFSSFADPTATPAYFGATSLAAASTDATAPGQSMLAARDSAPLRAVRDLAVMAMGDDNAGSIEVAGDCADADADETIDAQVRERLFAAHAGEDAAFWLLG